MGGKSSHGDTRDNDIEAGGAGGWVGRKSLVSDMERPCIKTKTAGDVVQRKTKWSNRTKAAPTRSGV